MKIESPTALLLTPQQVADLLALPLGTLASWRCRGTGPRFIRLGRCVRYRPSDVEAWLNAAEQASR